jgi:hypothetical protein
VPKKKSSTQAVQPQSAATAPFAMFPAVARVAADPSPPPPFAPTAGRTKRKSYIAAQAAIKNFGEILEAKDVDEDDIVVCEPDNDTSYRARLDRRRERGQPCGQCVRCLRPSCGSCAPCQRAPGGLSATVACVMRKCLRPVRAKTRKLWSLAAPAAILSEENKKIEFKTRDELMAFLNRGGGGGASSTQTAAQAGPNASISLGSAFSNTRGIASSAPNNKGGNHTFPHSSAKSQCRPPNDTSSNTVNRKPVDIFTVGSRSSELNHHTLPNATNNVRKVGGGATGMSRPPAAFAAPRLSGLGLNTFPCTVCRLRFRTRLEMIGHRSVYHNPAAAGVGPNSAGGAGQRRPSEAVTSPPKRQRTKSAAEEEEEDVFQRDLQAALRQSRREMKQAAANSESAVDQDPICLD